MHPIHHLSKQFRLSTFDMMPRIIHQSLHQKLQPCCCIKVSRLMQGTLKCWHTFGILAASRLNCSSVTTVPPFTFAQAITKGSATGVPVSRCFWPISPWKCGIWNICATNCNSAALGVVNISFVFLAIHSCADQDCHAQFHSTLRVLI